MAPESTKAIFSWYSCITLFSIFIEGAAPPSKPPCLSDIIFNTCVALRKNSSISCAEEVKVGAEVVVALESIVVDAELEEDAAAVEVEGSLPGRVPSSRFPSPPRPCCADFTFG